MTLMSPYYDPASKRAFRMTAIANLITNTSTKVQLGTKTNGNQRLKVKMRRFTFRSNGCNCLQLNCGCCLGINLSQFNFNREGKHWKDVIRTVAMVVCQLLDYTPSVFRCEFILQHVGLLNFSIFLRNELVTVNVVLTYF